MLDALVSLVVLLISAAVGARRAVELMMPSGATPGRLPRAIAVGTTAVAWCLACAQLPAYLAELADLPLARITVIAAISVFGAAVLQFVRRRGPGVETCAGYSSPRAGLGLGLRRIPRDIWWACVAPVAALHAFLVIDGLLRPPYGCDGLLYHLPMMVRWLRAGRLAMVPDVRFFNYPANGELWQMFFAAPRIEPLIELSMVPIGLLLSLIVAGISRELGATVRGALLAALFALVCPMIALQMYSTFVDMFGTTFMLGALYWLMRLGRQEQTSGTRHALILLIGLNLGLAIGTKFTFLPWAVLVLVGVLAATFRGPARPGTRVTAAGTAVLVLALAAFSTGGFWFARNLYHTGWVFYPLQLRIAGHNLGTGWTLRQVSPTLDMVDHGVACLAYPWREWRQSRHFYSPDNGLGPPLAAFVVAGLGYLAMRQRSWPSTRNRWGIFWAWVFMLAGQVFFLTVFRPAARYSLPGWAVMLAAVGPMMDVLTRVRPRLGLALASATLVLAVPMVGLTPARLLAGRLRDRDLSRAHAYQIPRLFDELPAGTVVLNAGSGEMNYPLLGAGWPNRVIEPQTAWARGLRRPYDRAGLDTHGVEIVYAPADLGDVFTAEVSYDVIYDDSADPRRPPTTPAARVYRIVRKPGTSKAAF